MIESREGTLNSKLRDRTVHDYIKVLETAAARRQNPIEKEVVRAAHLWIDGPTNMEGRLNLKPRPKVMTFSLDVTTILRELFTIEYMATFRTTRQSLSTSLFINLTVDCSGRVGEFLGTNVKDPRAKCLRWEHVKLYAFLENGKPTVKAKIHFRDLKGVFGNEYDRSKTVLLRLLPLTLAAEDSLRQLITLAIIDGVLTDIQC